MGGGESLFVSPAFSLLAFGFGNLAMLGWMAAAAVPFLIHLWSRHRFREAPWAAMQFLLAALRKNSQRLRIQQWLLLALRTLLIALVVLAVAEPYGENLAAGGASMPAHKVLVMDGSFSMAYRDGETSRFDRAKTLAADLVRNSRAGDSFTVIQMARQAKIIVGRETVDQDSIISEVQSLTQAHTTANLAAGLDAVEETLDDAANDARAAMRFEVYVFTDLQKSTWEGGRREATPDARANDRQISDRLEALGDRATVSVVDVGQSGTRNLAITKVALSEPFVTLGSAVGITATLTEFGQQARSDCKVELFVDGIPISQESIDVPAGSDVSIHFSHRFNSPGQHTIEARAASDGLPVDDSRWLVVPVRDEIRVLCVAGHEGAATYIADALNPYPQSKAAIQPTIVADGQLAEVELSDFDCIFLCNVAQLSSEEAGRLAAYAHSRGGVVFFLGDRVISASYNAFSPGGPTVEASRPPNEPLQTLLPVRIGEPVSNSDFGIDPLDYRHPIVAPFRGSERAGLLTTPISRYYRLETTQSPRDTQVAAATRGGDPLIVTSPLGRGRIAIVATDGSLSSIDTVTNNPWTLWPTWPSFLPIIRELLAYVGGDHADKSEHVVGTALHGLLPGSTSPGETVQVTGPDGRTLLAGTQPSRSGVEWSFVDTDLSGIYLVRGMPEAKSFPIAVNVDTTESDLARIDADKLPPTILIESRMQNPRDGGSANDMVSQAAWSQPLLWAALAILFLESLIAWLFGRGGA
jgi:hypothetical protein